MTKDNETPDCPENSQDSDGQKIARSTWMVSMLTMLSRILGLVRDKFLVVFFGGSAWVLDAFLLAFTIPNLFRRLFGEGALTAAFVPVFVNRLENESRESASRIASATLTLLAIVTGVISILGVVVAMGCALGMELQPKITLALKLTALMLPFLCLICCSALLSAMLQSLKKFFLPACMSIVLNLAFLVAFAYIALNLGESVAEDSIYIVGIAVLCAGFAQLVIQAPFVFGNDIVLKPVSAGSDSGVGEIVKAMGPTALGLGVVQVNVLIDNLIAYWISLSGSEGANTYLYLGNRLMQLPLGVFGIAVASTVFPYLSGHASREENEKLFKRILTSIRMLLFIMLPAAAGLGILADPIIRMIYQEPNLVFSHAAVYRTSAVLVCYSFGLVFFSIQHLLTRVFYARREYMTPVKIAVFMVFVNLALNLVLIHAPDLYLRWSGETIDGLQRSTLGEAGLALATSITAVMNVLILWWKLKPRISQKIGEAKWDDLVGELHSSSMRIIIAAAIMGAFVYFTRSSIPAEPELFMRLERGLVPVAAGIFGYIILCLVVPVPELGEFFRRGKKKSKEREEKED